MRRIVVAAAAIGVLGAGASQALARTVTFSGQTWTVKSSPTAVVGPGPNFFSDSAGNVWVDTQGRLHLRIVKSGGRWQSAEVIGTRSLGLGTYTWTFDSRVDALPPSVVLGLFTWSNYEGYANREMDVEFSRWGNPFATTNAQFAVQPFDLAGHLMRFLAAPAATSTHSFRWAPGSVAFTSSTGSVPSWTYTGADVPPPGDETPRMNLWLYQGAPPANGKAVEVVIRSFTFTPLPPG